MKKAFTLAEVLITLTILGVVASLTIASTRQNISQRETVLKVKHTYSLLSNAYDIYLITNPQMPPQSYSAQGATNVANMFLQSVQVANDVGTDPAAKRRIMHTGNYLDLHGKSGYNIYVDRNTYYLVVLKDGSHLWFKGIESAGHRQDNIVSDIFYDVNGRRGPNRRGYDMFEFNIADREIIPAGEHPTYDSFAATCSNRSTGSGWGCAAWIIRNNNMDYLKCDGLRLTDTHCPR